MLHYVGPSHGHEYGRGSGRTSRHRENRDHERHGQGLREICCRLQLLGSNGFPRVGKNLQRAGAGMVVSLLKCCWHCIANEKECCWRTRHECVSLRLFKHLLSAFWAQKSRNGIQYAVNILSNVGTNQEGSNWLPNKADYTATLVACGWAWASKIS